MSSCESWLILYKTPNLKEKKLLITLCFRLNFFPSNCRLQWKKNSIFIKKYYYCNGEKDSTFDLLKKSQGTKVNICVVGAGFSGLCMGVKLKNAGIKFQILEKDSEVGGTWSANKYPGCRCDVWSVLYQVRNYWGFHSIFRFLFWSLQLREYENIT